MISKLKFAHSERLSRFHEEIKAFKEFGTATKTFQKDFNGEILPQYINEFWTSKQRAAHSIHEISYRACFKPQLPRFFINRLSSPGDVVYDPFMGRGTTLLEAALLDRISFGCDINPLSVVLCEPRFSPPEISDVAKRLDSIPKMPSSEVRSDLLAFYHPDTLNEISALREYLLNRNHEGLLDSTDRWIRMVATNRLTGHSSGFFSVYTMPPNQAVSIESQIKINQKRNQSPPPRDIRKSVLKKTRTLLSNLAPLLDSSLTDRRKEARLFVGSAAETPLITDGSVNLVVTSPPFLDVVNYQQDNWLRCWFNGIDPTKVNIWNLKKVEDWQSAMVTVFRELARVLRPGGFLAFEVGEVKNGSLLLEDFVVPAGREGGLNAEMVVINAQEFTKTSNCWGVDNLKKGTNTNRIVLFSKPW